MKEITVDALKARMDAGEKIHLLDVREPSGDYYFLWEIFRQWLLMK